MKNWVTLKIDLAPEDEQFLKDRKTKEGITISFQLNEAISMYIKAVKDKEDQNA